MKKLLFILIMVFLSGNLYPSWIKTGEYDFLRTGSKIQSLAISSDSKYLYTSYDDGNVVKWDMETGDSLSAIKAVVPGGYRTSTGWCRISKDAKTFCCYYYLGSSNKFDNHLYIYDIETGNAIDSTMYIWPVYNLFLPEHFLNLVFADYNYKEKTLLWGTSTNSVNNIANLMQYYTGLVEHLKKDGDKWKGIFWISMKPVLINITDPDYQFFNTYEYYSSSNYPSNNREYHSRSTSGAYIYDKAMDRLRLVFNYSTEDYKTTAGKAYYMTSCIIQNNYIYWQYGDNITKFDPKLFSVTSVNKIGGYDYNAEAYIANSVDTNHYFVIQNNRLNINDFNKNEKKRTIIIDSVSKLTRYVNSTDGSIIMFTDEINTIIKFNYKNIYKLKANFSTYNTIFDKTENIKFKNLSLGYPTEYFWDFGDGKTSTEFEPTHVYSDTGSYSVRLIIKNNMFRDTIIKTNYLYILIKPEVSYEYTISKDDPGLYTFVNTTTGKYDSLKWKIGNDFVSSSNSFNYKFNIRGYYRLQLITYFKGRTFDKSEVLYVNLSVSQIPAALLVYELADTINAGYEAIKGFDDKYNNLIYHIRNNDNRYGCFINGERKWSVKDDSKTIYLFKRNKNIFSILNDSSLYNFDLDNNVTNVNNDIQKYYSIYASNYGETVGILDDNYLNFLFDIRNVNTRIDTLQNRPYPFSYVKRYHKLAKIYENNSDYMYSVDYEGYFYDKYLVGYDRFLNNHRINFDYDNFTRLNRKNIVVFNIDTINIFYSELLVEPSNVSNYSPTVLKVSKKINGFQFRNIRKLTDEIFVVAGDSAIHPAYAILNDSGEILSKKVFTERYGSFNFAYSSLDSILLFSGWSYYNYPYKTPYYLKIKEPMAKLLESPDSPKDTAYIPIDTTTTPKDRISKDSLGKANIIKHYIYPNPGNGEYTLLIEAKNNTAIEFEVADYTGIMTDNTKRFNIKKGINEFKIEISERPIGLFLYRIVLSDGVLSGKIIKLKN